MFSSRNMGKASPAHDRTGSVWGLMYGLNAHSSISMTTNTLAVSSIPLNTFPIDFNMMGYRWLASNNLLFSSAVSPSYPDWRTLSSMRSISSSWAFFRAL